MNKDYDSISREYLLNVLGAITDITGLGLEPVIAKQTVIDLIKNAPPVDKNKQEKESYTNE